MQPSVLAKAMASFQGMVDAAMRAAGSIEWGEETDWLPIARVEDDRSDFYGSDPITYRDLKQAVETFDPARRRIPIVCGMGRAPEASSGPGHWCGMYMPPLGEVTRLSFDGLNLWAKARAIVDPDTGEDRIAWAVTRGATERSVFLIRASAETGGKTMLWHLAQLSMGEGPGTPNMPTLDTWLSAGETDRARWSGIKPQLPSPDFVELRRTWRHFGSPATRDGQAAVSRPYRDGGEPAEETFEMKPEDVTAAVTAGFAAAVPGLVESLRAALAPPAPAAPVETTPTAAPVERAAEPAPPPAAPAAPTVDPQLLNRARVAVQAGIRCGFILPAEAGERAACAAAGGDGSVRTLEADVRRFAQISPRHIAEVRVSETQIASLDLTSHRFRVAGLSLSPDEATGTLLARALAVPGVAREDGSTDPAALERAALRLVAA